MPNARGQPLIGLLVVLAIMLVMGVILSNSINKATTGAGSTTSGSVTSFKDSQFLLSLYQSLAVASQLEGQGRFLVPSELTRRNDPRDNTTASFFSAMIAQNSIPPAQLFSANEMSPYLRPDDDYNYHSYSPGDDAYWDPDFAADLSWESNASFAHVPLHGNRLLETWRFTVGSRTPLLSNRGPKDGVENPESWTYGRNGKWAGHVVFADGHVEFVETFTLNGIFFESGGQHLPDNLFRMEQGAEGLDVILSFTQEMTEDGPVLQFD